MRRSKIFSQSVLREKLSSVMKKRCHALRQVPADDLLHLFDGAAARLAALHVDDGAERALERAAAAGVKAGVLADGAADGRGGQHRRGRALQRWQVVQVVIERLQLAVPRVAQNLIEAVLLGLAGEERDAHVHRLLQLRRDAAEHRQAARNVKAAEAHLNSSGAQRAGDVQRARKLVGLHADQHHQAALAGQRARDAPRTDARVVLIHGLDVDLNLRPEHAARAAVEREAVHHRQRVRRHGGAEPLDDVAIVVIVRGLDEDDREAARIPGRHLRIGVAEGHPNQILWECRNHTAMQRTSRKEIQDCGGATAAALVALKTPW